MSAECRSCGEPILWLEMRTTGRRMPVDVEPRAAGTIVIEAGMAIVLPPAERDRYTGDRYVPHWATCPHADQHRRAK